MLDKIKNFFTENVLQQLEKMGYKIDQATFKQALDNAPGLLKNVREILASNDPDKMTKIYNVIMQAAKGETSEQTKDHSEK